MEKSNLGKAARFGMLYGMSNKKLSEVLKGNRDIELIIAKNRAQLEGRWGVNFQTELVAEFIKPADTNELIVWLES
jgi:hypothetical protein